MSIRKLATRQGEPARISRLGQRRQVVIPQAICEQLHLREGDFVEVNVAEGIVLIKPKKLVDSADVLTAKEEKLVRKGEAQLRRGEYVTLAQLDHALDRPDRKRSRKTT